jgi:hypothetical protein
LDHPAVLSEKQILSYALGRLPEQAIKGKTLKAKEPVQNLPKQCRDFKASLISFEKAIKQTLRNN